MREMQTNGIPKQVELFDDEKRVERINLRNYQIGAIEAIENELKKVRSTALIMATGLGKTVIFASVARKFYNRSSKPVLVLAHRTELLEQATNTLEHFGLKCAVEQGEARTSFLDDHHAIAASVQSLSQIDRLREFPPDYFSLIITDECHHAPTPSYMTIYDHFKTVKHLGVTATPIRSDAVGLKNVYQTVAFQYSIQEGIKEKYLCKIKGRQIKVDGLELEKIKLSKNDFSKAELDEMLMRDKVLQKMVLPTIEYAKNRPTIVFTQTVGHAKAITDCFNRIGGKDIAVCVDGGTPELVRRERIEAFKSGEIQFIVNVGVLTEGFDHPPTACIALFRPTRSLGLLAQMVGRGTRLFENKKDCIAEGQKVLTDVGLVAIEQITAEMKVWDGCNFVSHCGIVFRGEREVITYAGLTATPDHEVWTEKGWLSFGECAKQQIPICVTGIGREAIRETENRFRRSCESKKPPISFNRVCRMWKTIAKRALQRNRRKGGLSASPNPEMVGYEGDFGKTKMHESERFGLRSIRRAWNKIQIFFSDSNGGLGAREFRTKTLFRNRPNKQRRALRTLQFALLNPQAEFSAYTENNEQCKAAQISTEIPSSSLRRFNFEPFLFARNDEPTNNQTVSPKVIQTKRRVWDILNAGHLHRFTVEGLLVSNCLILDFVGVNNSVKTLNVLDVLDGTILSDREKSAAQKLLDEGLDAETALEKAKLDIAKLEALEVKWKALSSSNAFDLMKLFAIPSCKGLYGGGLVTFPQRGLLENAGVKIPATLEKGEASKLIAEIIRRRSEGLATLKQLRYLKRLGCRDFDIEALTFNEAGKLISRRVSEGKYQVARFYQ